jgi:2-polyprenyl-3-methyl-5-hydroxy-6-metoxy-1,4-benzoquinol methylase
MKAEKQSYNELHKIWDSAHFGGSPTYMIRKILLKKEIGRILKTLKKRKNNISVLDVGCGTGDYVEIFKNYKVNYTGLDLSNYAINKLKRKYPSSNFICEDVFKVKLVKKFDIVFLSEVLEHITDEVKLLKKINNFLVGDGMLILSVPYDPKLYSYADEQAHHKRRYTKIYLKFVLEKSGFKCDKLICYGFPLLRIYWALTRKFRKRIQTSKNKSRIKKKLFLIINKIFLLDLLLIRTNWGVGLIALAKKN